VVVCECANISLRCIKDGKYLAQLPDYYLLRNKLNPRIYMSHSLPISCFFPSPFLSCLPLFLFAFHFSLRFTARYLFLLWTSYRSRYSDCLRAGWSGDRIPVGARFSAPVQTGLEAHPASCTMGTGSFLGG
jgi:hypothetical protein